MKIYQILFLAKKWSGKRGSNPRHLPWQGSALPLSYSRSLLTENCKRRAQLGVLIWYQRPDLNRYRINPEDFKSAVCLPVPPLGKLIVINVGATPGFEPGMGICRPCTYHLAMSPKIWSETGVDRDIYLGKVALYH